MDMDQAAVWLAGSILTTLGFLVILVGIVAANNIISKYWKPLGWSLFGWTQPPTHRYMTEEEFQAFNKAEQKTKNGKL